VIRGTTGVNSLPKTVTRQRRDCDLNPGSSAPESSTLTTRLPRHPRIEEKKKERKEGKKEGMEGGRDGFNSRRKVDSKFAAKKEGKKRTDKERKKEGGDVSARGVVLRRVMKTC